MCCQWVTAICILTENLGESGDVREVTDGFDLEMLYHCLWQVKRLIAQQSRQERGRIAAALLPDLPTSPRTRPFLELSPVYGVGCCRIVQLEPPHPCQYDNIDHASKRTTYTGLLGVRYQDVIPQFRPLTSRYT